MATEVRVWRSCGKSFKTEADALNFEEHENRVKAVEMLIKNLYRELTGSEETPSMSAMTPNGVISMLAMRPQAFHKIIQDWGDLQQAKEVYDN